MEALGLESVSKDRAKLEQRLLKAVSDLRILKQGKGSISRPDAEVDRGGAPLCQDHPVGDPEARMEVEAQLRATNQLLTAQDERSANEETVPDLMDGRVISVKEEWSLVVSNLGARQGVKLGMPLRVVRTGKMIATLRVVDVRERICGAMIQEMGSEKEKIKVGDRLQADARQNVNLK